MPALLMVLRDDAGAAASIGWARSSASIDLQSPPACSKRSRDIWPNNAPATTLARAISIFMARPSATGVHQVHQRTRGIIMPDRKSVVSGKGVSVRVDTGGRRIIKKKHTKNIYN